MDVDDLAELDRRLAEAIGWADVPPFSRNLETAWSVARHLWKTRQLYIALVGGGTYYRAEFAEAPDSARVVGSGSGATPAEAICRAALDALEGH